MPSAGRAAIALPLLAALAAADTADLSVTRVAIFSSGVGYFERDARVTGDARAELSFRVDQINDILKSLVVQDFDGGRIGVVSYASQDPIEKTLRSFAVDLTGKPTLGELLDQLRGEPVEITGGRSLAGVIVGVEKVPVLDPDGRVLQTVERLTLLTEGGLEQLELTRIGGIRLADPKIAAELQKALATLATAHDADKKSVALHFEGSGERRVRVAYMLEAPIWKTSYRLVLSDTDKPFIQGWATVENATEEDWNNVRLSLISGRPISFRMDLYTPLYVERPVEQLELYASLRPPSYQAGFEVERGLAEPAETALADAEKAARFARRAGRPAAQPAAPGMAGGMGGQTEERRGLALAGTGIVSVASAAEAGELFAYHIDTPVTLPRQRSAMLPIVNQPLEAEKVSIFNRSVHPKHPLNGLELKNTTGLNLMQGPVTVFDDDVYAGDAKLPDLKPDEKRLLAYALDLGTELLIDRQPAPDELLSLRIAKGTLIHRHRYVDEQVYRIRNKADRQRTVLIEHPYSAGWTLVEPKEPYERTESLLRFKVAAGPRETTSHTVRLERVADETIVLASVGLDQIRFFLRARVISPAVKQALEKVVALRVELDNLAASRARLEQELNEVVQQQVRVRENLEALDRSTDAYQRQLRIFDDFETQIGQKRAALDEARDTEKQKREALESYLLALDIE